MTVSLPDPYGQGQESGRTIYQERCSQAWAVSPSLPMYWSQSTLPNRATLSSSDILHWHLKPWYRSRDALPSAPLLIAVRRFWMQHRLQDCQGWGVTTWAFCGPVAPLQRSWVSGDSGRAGCAGRPWLGTTYIDQGTWAAAGWICLIKTTAPCLKIENVCVFLSGHLFDWFLNKKEVK